MLWRGREIEQVPCVAYAPRDAQSDGGEESQWCA
jgi:hypothetical protein